MPALAIPLRPPRIWRKLMPEFDETKLAGLIDVFFEAAARPELWRGLLADVADALGAAGCGLLGAPASELEPIVSPSMDEALDLGLRSGWLEKNLRMARGLQAFRRGHEIVTESMLFTPWELDHLPFNAEYVNRVKGRWFADIVLAGEGRSSIILTTQRLIGSEPFAQSELDTMRRLVPQMRRAVALALRLEKARHAGLFDALEALDCGALLLDWKGRITRLNAKAEALIAQAFVLRFQRLAALDRRSDRELQGLICSLIARGPLCEAKPNNGAVAVARPTRRPLIVQGFPLVRSARDLFRLAAAVLMITDPEARHGPSESLLCQAFQFTGAEAAIGVALCNGHDIDEIAQARCVSTATLRAQLKSMLAKTGTRRQAELVALLLRYAPIAR